MFSLINSTVYTGAEVSYSGYYLIFLLGESTATDLFKNYIAYIERDSELFVSIIDQFTDLRF